MANDGIMHAIFRHNFFFFFFDKMISGRRGSFCQNLVFSFFENCMLIMELMISVSKIVVIPSASIGAGGAIGGCGAPFVKPELNGGGGGAVGGPPGPAGICCDGIGGWPYCD